MAKIKSLLFITTQLPFPPISGGVIKSWKLVEYLSQHYSLTVAYFLKNNDRDYEAKFLDAVTIAGHIAIPLEIPRTPANLIRSNFLGIPLNLYRNYSKALKKEISLVSDVHDCIFIDHYEMFQYVPEDYHGKIVLHQHNCEYLMWERFGAIEHHILKKFALYNQAFWIKRYEKKICEKADSILAAPNDIEELVNIGADKEKFYLTYHLGDEELMHLPPLTFKDNSPTLLYIGTLSWEANVDGLVWFISEVWQKLSSQIQGIQLKVVGKNPDTRLTTIAAAYDNITFMGFVEELDMVYQDAQIFICPLRFGSGIKVKVMNALYRGIPCVTTDIGIEGLMAVDGIHYLLANTPDEYITQIRKLLSQKELWESISYNARALASEHYTWDAVMIEVENAIRN